MRYLILPLIFLFVSCGNGRDQYNDFINKQILENFSPEIIHNYSNIIIIPRQGCRACINGAEFFLKDNLNNENFLFIFTRINSEKQLRIELGEEILMRNNVMIDKKNLFYSVNYPASEYPLLLKRNESNLFEYKILVEI